MEWRHHLRHDSQSFDSTIEIPDASRLLTRFEIYDHECDIIDVFGKSNIRSRRVNADGIKWKK